MIRPTKTPLTPASLATDGIQGASAKATNPSEAKHTPHAAELRILALTGLDDVRALLARYVLMTDARCTGRHTMTGPKLTGCRCQCPTCGDYFGSVVVFDRHRVGSYAKPGELKHNRRCLSPSGMEARGWVRNGRGFWIRAAMHDGQAGIQAPRVTPPATHAPRA